MSKQFNVRNPRFVLVIGAIREVYPDIPDNIGDDGAIVLWDRQEQKPVVQWSQQQGADQREHPRHQVTSYPPERACCAGHLSA